MILVVSRHSTPNCQHPIDLVHTDGFPQRLYPLVHVTLLDYQCFASAAVVSRCCTCAADATCADHRRLSLADFRASVQEELRRFFQVGGHLP
jgi:hypothetical protein